MSEPLVHVEEVMGTRVTIDVRKDGDPPGAATAAAVRWLHRVDDTFSLYQPDSVLSRLRGGDLAANDGPPELAEVLALADHCAALTDGAFDPFWQGPADPTGVVKGWAAQRASEIMAGRGSSAHMVNAAGDLWAHGQPAPDRMWAVGISDPHCRGELVAVVHGADLAVATSGTAEHGPHIVDPRTGRPATAVASVTVVGADLGVADGLATAGVALGADAPDLLGRLDDEGWSSLVVFADGTRWSSPGFTRRGRVGPSPLPVRAAGTELVDEGLVDQGL